MKTILIFVGIVFCTTAAWAQGSEPSCPATARVVLRVQWLRDGEAPSKYAWQEVRVLSVLKNDSEHTFSNVVKIAHYNWTNGIPKAVCTVYLERYNSSSDDLWKLMGGSAATGVSNMEENGSANKASEAIAAPGAAQPQR